MKKNILILVTFLFLIISSGSVFASPNGVGIEASINQSNPNIWYSESNLIPLSEFSQSDCGYRDNNYFIKGQIFNSTGTNTGLMNFGTSKTQAELNAANGLLISWLWFKTPSNYPASGDYYYQFFGFASGQSVTCGSPAGYAYIPFHVDKENNTITPNSLSVNGVCGLDNGEITNAEPPISPNTLCLSGTASQVDFNGLTWTWTCNGSGGGSNADCISYNTLPVNATCGSDNGQTVTEITNACSLGSLMTETMLETLSGWTWTCGGVNGGSNADCSANLSTFTPPVIPEQEDCSILNIPDRWFCEISNAIKSVFLPSADKINELQITVNKINGRFPFNYLSTGKAKLKVLENTTISDGLELTILGNTGEINIDAVSPLAEGLSFFTSGLFMLGFVFWALGYIKHFFK